MKEITSALYDIRGNKSISLFFEKEINENIIIKCIKDTNTLIFLILYFLILINLSGFKNFLEKKYLRLNKEFIPTDFEMNLLLPMELFDLI